MYCWIIKRQVPMTISDWLYAHAQNSARSNQCLGWWSFGKVSANAQWSAQGSYWIHFQDAWVPVPYSFRQSGHRRQLPPHETEEDKDGPVDYAIVIIDKDDAWKVLTNPELLYFLSFCWFSSHQYENLTDFTSLDFHSARINSFLTHFLCCFVYENFADLVLWLLRFDGHKLRKY